MNLPDFGSHCFVCSFQALFGSFGWLLAFGARPVKTTRIIQNQPKSMTTETKKKLRTHKDTIKYISWILSDSPPLFCRPFCDVFRVFGPRLATTKSQTGVQGQRRPLQNPHLLQFGVSTTFLNPCFGFWRGITSL